jgi:hypothetical protein
VSAPQDARTRVTATIGRHKRLHASLDELVACFLNANPKKGLRDTNILELIGWSHAMTQPKAEQVIPCVRCGRPATLVRIIGNICASCDSDGLLRAEVPAAERARTRVQAQRPVVLVRVQDVIPPANYPFSQLAAIDDLEPLIRSFHEEGQLTPIQVTLTASAVYLQLLSGLRRLNAAKVIQAQRAGKRYGIRGLPVGYIAAQVWPEGSAGPQIREETVR